MNRKDWKEIWHHGVYLAKKGSERSDSSYFIPVSKDETLEDTNINDKEWVACVKMALLSPVPSLAFEYWREKGWLKHALPEIDKAWGMNQPELHHPEIDTGIHLMMVIDRASADGTSELARWAALAHDFGKHATYKVTYENIPNTNAENETSNEVKIRYSYFQHEKEGVPFVEEKYQAWGLSEDILKLSLAVTEFHGNVHSLENLKPQTILKIIKQAELDTNPEFLEAFCQAVTCDDRGRKGAFYNRARGTELLHDIVNNLIHDRLSYDESFEAHWKKTTDRRKLYTNEDVSQDFEKKAALKVIYSDQYEQLSVKNSLESLKEQAQPKEERKLKNGI